MIQKQDLFVARTGGYWNYRIPCVIAPTENVVLASAEARTGSGSDWDNTDIVLRRSVDGGRTFGPVVKLVDHTVYGPGPVSNFVMTNAGNGKVIALFCHDYSRVFCIHSDDAGAGFCEPREITAVMNQFRDDYPWRVCATGPGHSLCLRSGRIIIPVWLSDGGPAGNSRRREHHPSVVTLIYSDDGGQNWQRGPLIVRNGDSVNGIRIVDPNETTLVELDDGRVMCNIRNESDAHRRLVAVSTDGMSGWRTQGFDEALLEPVCMASMIRYRWTNHDGAGQILFANPDNLEKKLTNWAFDRKRLTVKVSRDDGKTWPVSRVLEEGPSGYSDMAVLHDGIILCFYECGMLTSMCDTNSLRLARFDIGWIRQ